MHGIHTPRQGESSRVDDASFALCRAAETDRPAAYLLPQAIRESASRSYPAPPTNASSRRRCLTSTAGREIDEIRDSGQTSRDQFRSARTERHALARRLRASARAGARVSSRTAGPTRSCRAARGCTRATRRPPVRPLASYLAPARATCRWSRLAWSRSAFVVARAWTRQGLVTACVRGCRVYGCRPGRLRRFRDGSELHRV
jgi:hypothetical protein